MTNAEAIEYLNDVRNGIHIPAPGIERPLLNDKEKEAVDLAISALEKQEQDRWIPTAEKEPDVNCLACDKFGQIFIPKCGIITVTAGDKRQSFDCPADFDFSDINAFFKGKPVGNGMRIPPKKIIAWKPLPEPYTEDEA